MMCVGRTAACIDMYKGRGPLGHSPKEYGVHRESRLPDKVRQPLMLSAFPPDIREHAPVY